MSENSKKPVYFQDKNPYNPYNFKTNPYNPYNFRVKKNNPYILATLEIAQFCTKLRLKMIAQSAIFSRKNVAQRKQKFALFAQKFCEWKP